MLDGGRAVVLGGGGVTGVAWETGLIYGLAEQGIDLSAADAFVGTSAGAAVAAQVSSGTALEQLFANQETSTGRELPARLGLGGILRFMVAGARASDRGRAALGRAALQAGTVSEADRLAVIDARLPSKEWPERPLLVTVVDAATGKFIVFDRHSGVRLVDAVAASCAVPTVWAPVTIDGRRYIDGGVRSIANVDVATGCERLVVIAPGTQAVRPADRPRTQAASLGVPFTVVSPDAEARRAMGRNPLDIAMRAASARAGRAQAARVADQVRAVWK